jgi:hypothetical protein
MTWFELLPRELEQVELFHETMRALREDERRCRGERGLAGFMQLFDYESNRVRLLAQL